MKQFSDNRGRTWDVILNVGTVKRIRDLLNVDLMGIFEDRELLGRLATDPVLLVDVLYVVVNPQDVTDEQFGEALTGDAIDDATQALLEELADFFPRARREVLKKTLTRVAEIEDRGMMIAMEKLDDPKLIPSLLASFGSSSTSSPAGLESSLGA